MARIASIPSAPTAILPRVRASPVAAPSGVARRPNRPDSPIPTVEISTAITPRRRSAPPDAGWGRFEALAKPVGRAGEVAEQAGEVAEAGSSALTGGRGEASRAGSSAGSNGAMEVSSGGAPRGRLTNGAAPRSVIGPESFAGRARLHRRCTRWGAFQRSLAQR